jgi:DNA-binding transcriptional LysR family regulator
MALDLLQLRAVSTAARLGSFSKAAEALNITQSALSRRISDVESSLGVVLFQRLARGVRPTEACAALLRHVEIALASLKDGVEAALALDNSRVPNASIALLDALCDDRLVAALKRTSDAFGPSALDFKTYSLSADVSSELLTGTAKLGLRYRLEPRPHVDGVWIADDPLVVACAPSHPLAQTRRATLDDLEREQWIGYPIPVDQTKSTLEEALRVAGFAHWKTTSVTTIPPRLRLIEAGFGIGMLRRAAVADRLQDGRLIEIETPLSATMPIFIAWRRGSYLWPAAELLRDSLIDAYRGAGPDA